MKSKRSIGILGLGKCIPKVFLSNQEIEIKAKLTFGSIEKITGIKTRYIANEFDTASGLSSVACREAMDNAKISPNQINSIIACTFTADYVMPALACKIHQILGLDNASAFDVMANCTGFQVGLNIMSDNLALDNSQSFGLVIGAALHSRFVNWNDKNSCIYFGDGFGAAVLGEVPSGYGFLAHDKFTNSSAYESVRIRGGGSSFPMRNENINSNLNYYEINGIDVWKQVIQFQPKVIKRALAKANLDISDVNFFIFHQANENLIKYLMGKMNISIEKTYINISKYGNTAEASMAIALCDAVEERKIKSGDIVVISGVGAGFTYGASVMKWWHP